MIIKEKKLLFVDVFLPLVLQQLYLHGLHHKLSWSSPNKARHFFGVFASVSQRGRHKHTHRDKKKRKEENGHVIAQTKTWSQGLGLGRQHWDILHYDQAIGLQILQAQTCQSQRRLLYFKPCNETPVHPHPPPIMNTNAQTAFIQTIWHRLWTPFFPNRMYKSHSEDLEIDRQGVAGGSWEVTIAWQNRQREEERMKSQRQRVKEEVPVYSRLAFTWPWPVQAHTIHTCMGHTSYSVGRAQSALDTS